MNTELVWKIETGTIDGLEYSQSFSAFTRHGKRFGAGVLWRAGEPVWLVINGYRFEYPTIEAAKADAADRIEKNRGVYLPWL